MNGTDLKVRRIRAHVRAIDLADAAGWKRPRVSYIESRAFNTPEVVDRYLAALDKLVAERATSGTVTTEGAA